MECRGASFVRDAGVAGAKRLVKARLEPSAGLKEHITFQSNFVQLSSYRLQIEVDSQRRLWEGFRAGRIPATNVKRIFLYEPLLLTGLQIWSQVAARFESVEALQRTLDVDN